MKLSKTKITLTVLAATGFVLLELLFRGLSSAWSGESRGIIDIIFDAEFISIFGPAILIGCFIIYLIFRANPGTGIKTSVKKSFITMFVLLGLAALLFVIYFIVGSNYG